MRNIYFLQTSKCGSNLPQFQQYSVLTALKPLMALLIFKPLNTNQWSFLHGVSNRARRALENRTMIDDDRIALMEDQLKQAKFIAEEREQMYEEVCYSVRPNTNPPNEKSRLESQLI